MNDATSVVILMADDDADDRLLTTMALREERLDNDVRTVCDGIELMDYLKRRGQFADPETSPTPSLILLDLNMPRMDGREALREIKADAALRSIPCSRRHRPTRTYTEPMIWEVTRTSPSRSPSTASRLRSRPWASTGSG